MAGGYHIPARRLPALKEYKYAGADKSLVSKYLLGPYWSWLVTLLPLNMAPNLVTLTGLACVGINVLTLIWYLPGLTCTPKPVLRSLGGTFDPLFPPQNALHETTVGWVFDSVVQSAKRAFTGRTDGANEVPALSTCPPLWLYFTWAIGLFAYQSLDAIDGKQARRTKQSGPLGEMFDHGCDAVNTTLEVLLTAAAINLGQSWWTVACLVATAANFYLTTWEEYHTKVLFLSVFSGPVEGILMIIAIYVVTGFYGSAFWDQGILTLTGLDKIDLVHRTRWLQDLPLNECFLLFGLVGLLFNIASSSRNVIAARRKEGKSLVSPLFGLLPFAINTATNVAWLHGSPAILRGHLMPFAFFWGISFAYQVGLLITAHTTHAPFPFYNALMLWSAVGALDANAPLLFGRAGLIHANVHRAVYFVYASVAVAFLVYAFFIYDVVGTICEYMDMNCLTIKYKPGEEPEKPAAQRDAATAAKRRSKRA